MLLRTIIHRAPGVSAASGTVLGLVLACVFPANALEDREFFETRVRPVLAEHCFECHGPEKQKAGLRLDHLRFILDGGESGPALDAGDAASSRLVRAVGYGDADLQMPPPGKLDDAHIADITAWIDAGAYWPEEPLPDSEAAEEAPFDLEARAASHWAWRPPEVQTPPPGDSAHPIDRFVHARLAEADLRPAQRASKEVLLRRLSYDLTGLPPSPARRAAFLSDEAPDAYAHEVERLLASPAFGERWARHWMDLVRFSETYGHEQDFPILHAWRYRDYLIRAFNDDVPYDQLLTEHIAGDLLDTPRLRPGEGYNESVLGTGFWFMYQATHAPVDPLQDRADRIDNQVDVFSKAFLGMTVACARCHDHMFDAISMKDYYALGGYLRSSRRHLAFLTPEGEIEEAAAKLRKRHAAVQGALDAYIDAPDSPEPEDYGEEYTVYEDFNGDSHHGWMPSGEAFHDYRETGARWIAGGEAALTPPGAVHSGHVSKALYGMLRSPSFAISHDNIHIRAAGVKGTIRVIVEDYLLSDLHKLLFENTVQKIDTDGEYKWFSVTHSLRKFIGMEAYFEFEDGGEGFVAVDEIVFSDSDTPPESSRDIANGMAGPLPEDAASMVAETYEAMRKIAAAMPAPIRALTMTDGSPTDGYVQLRGDPHNQGAQQPRRFLEALGGVQAPAVSSGSGRLELAKQVTAPENPLTARVFVNRVWQHLIGRGIVATPDNFGVLGETPSHPELLDYLARRFVAQGWSIKELIRDIVTSETYRMSSLAAEPRAETVDPANILLHRAHVRRLEGEAIRDALLAASGSLDESMYGPSVPIYLSPFMGYHRRPKKSGPMDGAGRRSIYVEVRRNFLSPMMMAFDVPAPDSTFGLRTKSNVPAQALVMMNNPFVTGQAEQWAKRLLERDGGAEERISAIYLGALGRQPEVEEYARMRGFLEKQGAAYGLDPREARNDPRVWRDLCHVVFMLKEFIYLR